MYSIFHPLDVDERLPRELILEGNRHRWLELRHIEIFGFLYLPLLILAVVVLGTLSMLVAFAVGGAALIGVYAFVLATRHR
jgi:TRAP-type mannitol/chloroaromatic compound transport system permease large subunit